MLLPLEVPPRSTMAVVVCPDLRDHETQADGEQKEKNRKVHTDKHGLWDAFWIDNWRLGP